MYRYEYRKLETMSGFFFATTHVRQKKSNTTLMTYIYIVDIKFFKHVSGTVARVFCKFLSRWFCSTYTTYIYIIYNILYSFRLFRLRSLNANWTEENDMITLDVIIIIIGIWFSRIHLWVGDKWNIDLLKQNLILLANFHILWSSVLF